jgi:hypothetical protein
VTNQATPVMSNFRNMSAKHPSIVLISTLILLVIGIAGSAIGVATADSTAPNSWAPAPVFADPTATTQDHLATQSELETAEAEWLESSHSDTFDMGLGANTTCARCKSPMNWDPSAGSIEASLDCYACKRVPGESRPLLPGGETVSRELWQDIKCDICHVPVGDTYQVDIAFWDQSAGAYQPVESVMELCAHCHEGQHGFEVIGEQEASPVHTGWECTQCHGSHGAPSSCEDCHDPEQSSGAEEHERHPDVNCTACHDAGSLTIRLNVDPESKHFGEFIPVRFAHALTSWPSHNLGTEIICERCHHPTPTGAPAVDTVTPCTACHPDGAMWTWCVNFERDIDLHPEMEQAYP